MYFKECATLARRSPGLASVVALVDEQLQDMDSAELLRAADFASFLDVDQKQVAAVFERLTTAGLLVCDEIVECPACDMAVARPAYEAAMIEDGECCCSTCDSPIPRSAVRGLEAFRSNDEWPVELPPDEQADTDREPESTTDLPSDPTQYRVDLDKVGLFCNDTPVKLSKAAWDFIMSLAYQKGAPLPSDFRIGKKNIGDCRRALGKDVGTKVAKCLVITERAKGYRLNCGKMGVRIKGGSEVGLTFGHKDY